MNIDGGQRNMGRWLGSLHHSLEEDILAQGGRKVMATNLMGARLLKHLKTQTPVLKDTNINYQIDKCRVNRFLVSLLRNLFFDTNWLMIGTNCFIHQHLFNSKGKSFSFHFLKNIFGATLLKIDICTG